MEKKEEINYYQNFDIADIANIKEKNCFLLQPKINIFRLAHGHEEEEIGSEETLAKRSFAHDRVVEKFRPMKIPILRDISKLGRKLISTLKV